MPDVYQINLQRHFGGGEVYARFLCLAMAELGWRVHLLVDQDATFWPTLDLGETQLIPVRDAADAASRLPDSPALILTHGSPPAPLIAALQPHHRLAALAHMPLRGRNPEPYRPADIVFGVSAYVIETLREHQINQVHPVPLWGIANPLRTADPRQAEPIRQQSRFDWDNRKVRDRLLGMLYPSWRRLRQLIVPPPVFQRRPGITLGIVSRLTPIKQFPLLMQHLAPILARHQTIQLEIFGAGGYASVRDLRRALAPLTEQGRVRFWGHQSDVASVYTQLDYLLSGLPEKEALGLNIIEAQWSGTPVIAVDAPPFTETVVHGETGFLYRDPRQDQGAGFEQLIEQLETASLARPDPLLALGHLAQFSFAAFKQRINQALPMTEAG